MNNIVYVKILFKQNHKICLYSKYRSFVIAIKPKVII
jgi:hypothetical protein